ncbi:hypothetical protein PQR75_00815 [Paraburkholderia fungorum]|uniref:hypothetical protein n=1 Tax=Paraburkholderia fungorum TaxID=134537 RepID=UPI0038BDA9AE
MSNVNGGWVLEPGAPTLYIGFSGVFHVGEGLIDDEGNITLDSGNRRFECAPYLVACWRLTPRFSWY